MAENAYRMFHMHDMSKPDIMVHFNPEITDKMSAMARNRVATCKYIGDFMLFAGVDKTTGSFTIAVYYARTYGEFYAYILELE